MSATVYYYDDPIDRLLHQTVHHTVILLDLADISRHVQHVWRLVVSAPDNQVQVADPQWLLSDVFFIRIMQKACAHAVHERETNPLQWAEFCAAERFWCDVYPNLSSCLRQEIRARLANLQNLAPSSPQL